MGASRAEKIPRFKWNQMAVRRVSRLPDVGQPVSCKRLSVSALAHAHGALARAVRLRSWKLTELYARPREAA
jgi:hypothetical protein